MLDAYQLNIFLTAAETLSFTVAAKRLHMTQPSVSQHIQALETRFGAPLFVRSGRHLRLTDAGAALVPLARELISVSLRVEETMESLKGDVHGQLVIGCSTTPGKYILPMLLAEFMRRHPGVTAICHVTPRRTAFDMLVEGTANFALASARDAHKDLEFKHFITDPVLLIAPLDHPWARRTLIDPDELLDVDFILREEPSGTFMAARDGLEEVGVSIHQLRKVLTLGNSEAIALAVQEGIGVGFISHAVESRLVHGRVARIRVRGLNMHQDIYMARHIRRPATTAQTAFWLFAHDPINEIVRQLNNTTNQLAVDAETAQKV